MTQEQRRFLADKLAGTANINLGALAISQFLTDRPFRAGLFFMGLVIYARAPGHWILAPERRHRR